MRSKLILKLKLSLAMLAIFCATLKDATAQTLTTKLVIGAELEKGEKAPFRGTLLPESTLQRIYADLLKKDAFQTSLESCQVETASLAEKSESNEVTWFFAGTAIGLSAAIFIPILLKR